MKNGSLIIYSFSSLFLLLPLPLEANWHIQPNIRKMDLHLLVKPGEFSYDGESYGVGLEISKRGISEFFFDSFFLIDKGRLTHPEVAEIFYESKELAVKLGYSYSIHPKNAYTFTPFFGSYLRSFSLKNGVFFYFGSLGCALGYYPTRWTEISLQCEWRPLLFLCNQEDRSWVSMGNQTESYHLSLPISLGLDQHRYLTFTLIPGYSYCSAYEKLAVLQTLSLALCLEVQF